MAMRGRRRLLAILALAAGFAGCSDDCDGELDPIPPPEDHIDEFSQNAASKVDILWVIDDSESMAHEQAKVSNGFTSFFGTLLESDVDYHIGVITTDPDRQGVLRPYDGPSVPGCAACRFLTPEVACEDPTVDVAGKEEPEAEAELFEKCHAQLVFRNLIAAGIGGNPFEEGFAVTAKALGLDVIDAETGQPGGIVPPENEGFIRDDASLYVIYVSDEDEGDKQDGSPIRYYQRLFEDFKGQGDEQTVSVSAIVGWPLDNQYPTLSEVCPILETTYDGDRTTDDPRAATVVEAMTTGTLCEDIPAPGEDPVTRAETGSRYIDLACRTGGVVTNMCDADYSTALDALGANAAGLQRKFVLTRYAEMNVGSDCTIFTTDDFKYDCDRDGEETGDLDGPICVFATPLGDTTGTQYLVPRSEIGGWTYEPETGSINFRGGLFIPAPGTVVRVEYRIRQEGEHTGCEAPL